MMREPWEQDSEAWKGEQWRCVKCLQLVGRDHVCSLSAAEAYQALLESLSDEELLRRIRHNLRGAARNRMILRARGLDQLSDQKILDLIKELGWCP